MLVAVEYLGKVGVGVTSPHFFRANNGLVYVVKSQNNRLGAQVLASEFVGAKFGEIMNLCFPPSGIIDVSEDFIQNTPELVGTNIIAGRHFASQRIENADYISLNNIKYIANIKEMAGIVLFDHIFHNSDRTANRRNLLMQPAGEGYRIFAIDNSHLFRSGRWTLDSLTRLSNSLRVYYQRSYGAMLRNYLSPEDFLPYLEKFEQLTDQQIEAITESIPPQWLPGTAERQAIAAYIKQRRDLLHEIWRRLTKRIPYERGGTLPFAGKVIGGRRKHLRKQKSS